MPTDPTTQAEVIFTQALEDAIDWQDMFWDALEEYIGAPSQEKEDTLENLLQVQSDSLAAWVKASEHLDIWNKSK